MNSQQLGIIIFLAIVLVFVIPIMVTKNGGSYFGSLKAKGPVTQGNQPQNPGIKHNNGSKAELLEFMASLIRYAGKHGMQPVCPGALEHKGKTARFSALLVTNGGVIGIYCLGFGGTITANRKGGWKQSMNGKDRILPNYYETCEEWTEIAKDAMREIGLGHIPFRTVAIFTNKSAVLHNISGNICFTADAFPGKAESSILFSEGNIAVEEVSRQLAAIARKDDPRSKK